MTDPSSQKPSEQQKEGDKQDKPQSKLKLKPLVSTDSEIDESAEEGSQTTTDKKQAGMKLKHLMSPLSPHLKKVRESDSRESRNKPTQEIPSAVPYDEPGMEAVPPGIKPPVEAPPPNIPTPGLGPVETADSAIEPPRVEPAEVPQKIQLKQRVKPSETGESEPSEETEEPVTEALVSAPKKQSPKLLKYAVLLVSLLVVLIGVQYYFDPLGLNIESFEHVAPVVPKQVEDDAVSDAIAIAIAPIKSIDDLESVTIESFIEQLGQAQILASNSPQGVIINSIFYPVGSTLHPTLGIVIDEVEKNGRSSILTVIDSEGNLYEYPAK